MVSHLMQTPLLPEKLKLCMDRDLNALEMLLMSLQKRLTQPFLIWEVGLWQLSGAMTSNCNRFGRL